MAKPRGYNQKVPLPTRESLLAAFEKTGSQRQVAVIFDVSRATVLDWQRYYRLENLYHHEIPLRRRVKDLLAEKSDRTRLAQWIADEGTISTIYDEKNDATYLSLAGSMADDFALKEIARIVGAKVNNETSNPVNGWMPLGYIRVNGAQAYAIIEMIRFELIGLKRFQAEEALDYFPESSRVKGRHTADEFMLPAWEKYARSVMRSWNRRRLVPLPPDQIRRLVECWVAARIKRARIFRDGIRKRD